MSKDVFDKEITIRVVDRDNGELGKNKTFYISHLVPAVRKNLFNLFFSILENMTDEAIEAFKNRKYDLKNIATILQDIVKYLLDNDKLERLTAIVVCPEELSERNKDIDKIEDFLIYNAPISKQMHILYSFFLEISPEEIYEIYLSIRRDWSGKIMAIKQITNQIQSEQERK